MPLSLLNTATTNDLIELERFSPDSQREADIKQFDLSKLRFTDILMVEAVDATYFIQKSTDPNEVLIYRVGIRAGSKTGFLGSLFLGDLTIGVGSSVAFGTFVTLPVVRITKFDYRGCC